MDIDLKLQGDDIFGAQIQLLINILATQQATANVLFDKLSDSDEEYEKLQNALHEETKNLALSIHQTLFEQRGKIDLNDILGGK